MKTPYLVASVSLGLALSLAHGGSGAAAQTAPDDGWRSHFAAGEEARVDGRVAAYAREMTLAAEAMAPGLLNRPFTQYHAARAHALLGRPHQAVGWLDRMWEEDIEALMSSFAVHDPAFDGMREHAGFRRLLARPASMELAVRPLDGAVSLLEGAGANVVASVGGDGVLLVDTGYGPALPALRRALAALAGPEADGGHGEVPAVSTLVLTHPHEDHWGAAPELGLEATVVGHPGTARAMDEPYVFMEGVEVPPKPPAARPDRLTTDSTFAFNGEEVRIVAVEAHTGADLAVHFPGSGVLALGDAWLAGNPMMYPGTEDPEGFLGRLEAFLVRLPPETVVVGGHDPPTDPATVLDQIRESRGCMELVGEALDQGLSLEETLARVDGRYPAPWVGFFHRTLGG